MANLADTLELHANSKMSATAAGYMELEGAVKDGGCKIVNVSGGVSQKKGCCNEYKPQQGADEFRCGECKFVKSL